MIIEKFQQKVEEFPNKIAVKAGNRAITYRQLNTYANQVASAILAGDQQRHPTTDNLHQEVSLLFEHGADMIIAVIGALKAGKTYVPLDITYPFNRLIYMLENSDSYLVLTNRDNLSTAAQLVAQAQTKIDILNIDDIIDENAESTTDMKLNVNVNHDSLAYILYTSGSTGRPKGVIQTHQNVMYYTRNWIQRFSITDSDRMTLFSAFSHDGSVQDMFAALLAGATLYPYNIKTTASTDELYTLLMKEKITIWHSVPTLYRYFTNTLTEKNCFYDIRWVLLGGEPLRPHDLELLRTHFPTATLANVYGQTESSVSTICAISQTDMFDEVSLGEPLDQTKILIVGEDGEIIETTGSGEIVVACQHLALGYWHDQDSTQKVFTHDDELGSLYWTGDLGRLTMDGSIKVMGRKDSQIKIRGFRIETGEIESVLLQHEAVNEAVVIAREDEKNDSYLCVYMVADKTISPEELRKHLSRELPDYMVPRYFISLEEIPLTPNGKIDRQRLPEPAQVIASESVYVPPSNEIETKLVVIWQEVLAVEKVGIDDNFIELGGHSLLVVSIISRIHQEFQVELQLKDVFDHPTVRELSGLIMAAEASTFSSVPCSEKKEYYIATPDQERMYALNQFEGIGTTYNLAMTIQLNGPFDRHRFEGAFAKLIQRHESMRTSFRVINQQVVQVIHDPGTIDFQIPYIDLESEASSQNGARVIKETINRLIRPFDLGKAPLLRITLIKLRQDKHLLILDVHHIISDGMSEITLSHDFHGIYEGEELSALKLKYRDYSEWLDHLRCSGKIQKQEEYWLNCFKGEIPALNMPLDFPRPALQNFQGDLVHFRLGKEKIQQLNLMAKETGTTLFMILLAVYNVLLHKYTGQEDIVIGSIIAGRPHVDLEHIVGFFAKTLALRNRPAAHQPFDLFLEQLKNNTLEAFENQLYPFDQLIEKLKLVKNWSRNFLFDAAFLMLKVQNDRTPTAAGELKPEHEDRLIPVLYGHEYSYEIPTTMFELYLQIFEIGDELLGCIQYSTKLFKRETIELMKERYLTLVESILNNRTARIQDLDYTITIEKELNKVEEVAFDF